MRIEKGLTCFSTLPEGKEIIFMPGPVLGALDLVARTKIAPGLVVHSEPDK